MIFVECNPDAVLVEALTRFKRRDIIHDFRGKGELCNRLSRQKNSIGLVDEDPGDAQPRYLTSLQVIEDVPETGLRLLRDNANSNIVVLLCPNLESWTIRAASLAGIDLVKYKLSDKAQELHRTINLKLDEFRVLVAALRATNSRSVHALKGCLRLTNR